MNFNTNKIVWKPSSDILLNEDLSTYIENGWSEALDNIASFDWLWEDIDGLINLKSDYVKESLVQNVPKKVQNMYSNIAMFGKGNIVEKIIDINVEVKGNQKALTFSFDEQEKELSFEEIQNSISKVVSGLKEIGFKKGDRAIIAMPFIPEGLYALLGTIKMGGVSVPIIFDYSQDDLQKIISITQAKVLFTVDSLPGDNTSSKIVKNHLDEVLKKCPTIEIVIVVNANHDEINWQINRDAWWDDLVESQQLIEPVDTTNTGEPHIIFYYPKENSKSKSKSKKEEEEPNLYLELGNLLKKESSDLSLLWLTICSLLHNFKLEEIKA